MDYLGFLISEQVDYLQHSCYPYLQRLQGFVKNCFQSISSHVLDQCQFLWIHIKSTVQWHWNWSKELWSYLRLSTSQFSHLELSRLRNSLDYITVSVKEKVDQTHVLMWLSGVVIGITIGMQIKSSIKAQVTMRAVVCTSYNGPESISVVEDMPAPKRCGPSEVLVEVKAFSLDNMDIHVTFGYGKTIREQYYCYKGHGKRVFPFPLGRECSGRVIEVGSKVCDIDIGDEVYAAVPYYACGVASEIALIPSEWVAKKPSNLTHEAASALPYSASVAWNALVLQASLSRENTPGKRILIHAVQNPVGQIAAQLIKAWGGHVTATVTRRGLSVAQRIGIDDFIVYDCKSSKELDFNAVLATKNKFDVVLNTVGSFLHDSSKELCAEGGIVVSTVATPPASDHYGVLFGSLYSWFLRVQLWFVKESVCSGTIISNSVLNEITKLANEGRIQPILERIFDASQAEQAAKLTAKGLAVGKMIVRFR